MELIDIFRKRRSIRKYTGEKVTDEQLQQVIEAGMMSPSGHGKRSWEMIVVRDRQTLDKLSECRVGASKMLAGADAAVVVIGDADRSEVWTEDCSVALAYMHLMADGMGLGSCWIQGRLREAPNGQTTEEYVRDVLGYPERCKLEGILSLGVAAEHPAAHTLADIPEGKVHYEKY